MNQTEINEIHVFPPENGHFRRDYCLFSACRFMLHYLNNASWKKNVIVLIFISEFENG